MSTHLLASILAVILSLGSMTAMSAPASAPAGDQPTAQEVRSDSGKVRYWSHPRLGMVKVDAAGRMLTGRNAIDEAKRQLAPAGHPSTRVP